MQNNMCEYRRFSLWQKAWQGNQKRCWWCAVGPLAIEDEAPQTLHVLDRMAPGPSPRPAIEDAPRTPDHIPAIEALDRMTPPHVERSVQGPPAIVGAPGQIDDLGRIRANAQHNHMAGSTTSVGLQLLKLFCLCS